MAIPLVLIVEDDAKLSEIFALTLQATGYQTERVTDGAVALTRLSEIIPDLLVLDLHLPNVAGPDILQHIRADARLAQPARAAGDGRRAAGRNAGRSCQPDTAQAHQPRTVLSVLAARLLTERGQS